MTEQVGRVVIGMDHHERSVTIEVMTADEDVIGDDRFDTTVEAHTAMLEYVAAWPDRVWAVEVCEGIDPPEDAIARLRELVTSVPGRGVLAGPDPARRPPSPQSPETRH